MLTLKADETIFYVFDATAVVPEYIVHVASPAAPDDAITSLSAWQAPPPHPHASIESVPSSSSIVNVSGAPLSHIDLSKFTMLTDLNV